MRPVVISSSSKDFTVDGSAKALATGTYPNIAAVMYEMMTKASGLTATFSTDMKVVLTKSGTFTVTWDDANLRNYLGFTGNLSGNASYTATYTPLYCWFPSRVRADNGAWGYDQKKNWKGKEAISGNVCGLSNGSAIYRTSIEYEALNDYEVLISRGATTYQQNRCLEYFAYNDRVAFSASGDVSASGFYYFPDYTAVTIGPCAGYTSGSAANFHLSSGASTFVFAQFDPNWYPEPKATIKAAQTDWYDVNVECHSATAPTWSGA